MHVRSFPPRRREHGTSDQSCGEAQPPVTVRSGPLSNWTADLYSGAVDRRARSRPQGRPPGPRPARRRGSGLTPQSPSARSSQPSAADWAAQRLRASVRRRQKRPHRPPCRAPRQDDHERGCAAAGGRRPVTVLLDANMLTALLVGDHVHHGAAENWFVGMSGNFATCPIIQGSLMRLLIREGQPPARHKRSSPAPRHRPPGGIPWSGHLPERVPGWVACGADPRLLDAA